MIIIALSYKMLSVLPQILLATWLFLCVVLPKMMWEIKQLPKYYALEKAYIDVFVFASKFVYFCVGRKLVDIVQ